VTRNVIGQEQGRDFPCHLFHTKRTHWAKAQYYK